MLSEAQWPDQYRASTAIADRNDTFLSQAKVAKARICWHDCQKRTCSVMKLRRFCSEIRDYEHQVLPVNK